MKQIKYYCDICGKDFDDYFDATGRMSSADFAERAGTQIHFTVYQTLPPYEKEYKHLCIDCNKAVRAAINRILKERS